MLTDNGRHHFTCLHCGSEAILLYHGLDMPMYICFGCRNFFAICRPVAVALCPEILPELYPAFWLQLSLFDL